MSDKQPSCTDINEPGLISVDHARAEILNRVSCINGLQRLAIESVRGRILGNNLLAPFNVPPFANSAVDGYAFHHVDQGNNKTTELTVSGVAFAGQPFKGKLENGQCLRIMTGAQIPDGLDTVIMQEHIRLQENRIAFNNSLQAGQNVRYAGEDIQQGQVVLAAGKYLTAADIGLMAALGFAEIDVRRRLRVAIASTGDELCDIGSVQQNGIYDSNRYSLMAALDRPEFEVIDLGILADNPEAILQTFTNATAFADLIISSGGVSVGDADYTKTALLQAGDINFWKVAIKPGRPLAFGALNGKPFFGLPGNPVAVLVTFYQFVLPALEKMLGLNDKPIAPQIRARSLQTLPKKPGRTEIQRGILAQADNGEWTVKTTGKQGSGILSSMSSANAFIILPHESGSFDVGDWVTVQPFSGIM